jgi:hypothetical protein
MSLADSIVTASSPVVALRGRAPRETPALPDIGPGQLWLVEVAAGSPPSRWLCRLLDEVNVVLYDRALTDLVAESLPLGGYAEPAASGDEQDDRAASRAVRFAFDGWSVARLVLAQPTQRERVLRARRLADELAAGRAFPEVDVIVRGELSDGVCEQTQTRLNRLDQVLVSYPRDARLTILVNRLNNHAAAQLHAVAANGLAG